MTPDFNIGFRDPRATERCRECKKRGEIQDWCNKYNENINHCITTCVDNHPICPRDHPEIKDQLTKEAHGKWIIYHSDAYYPSVDVYDNENEARAAWNKIRKSRRTDDPNYFDTDYLAKVVESIFVIGEKA